MALLQVCEGDDDGAGRCRDEHVVVTMGDCTCQYVDVVPGERQPGTPSTYFTDSPVLTALSL